MIIIYDEIMKVQVTEIEYIKFQGHSHRGTDV